MKAQFVFAILILNYLLGSWAAASQVNNQFQILQCLEREFKVKKSMFQSVESFAAQKIQIKIDCLQFVNEFSDFVLLSTPVCSSDYLKGDTHSCDDLSVAEKVTSNNGDESVMKYSAYLSELEKFISDYDFKWINNYASLEDVKKLTCSVSRLREKVRILHLGTIVVKNKEDWDRLTKPQQCGNERISYDYAKAVYDFKRDNQKRIESLVLNLIPESLDASVEQLLLALSSLQVDFKPIMNPSLDALQKVTLELKEILPTGEQNQQVREQAQLVSMFDGVVDSFAKPWQSSHVVGPICLRLQSAISYLKAHFQFDKSILIAMKAIVARAALANLKVHVDAEEAVNYINPLDLKLGMLFNQGRVGGDASPETRKAYENLMNTLTQAKAGKISILNWLENKETSSRDATVKDSASELLKQIELIKRDLHDIQ